MVWTVLLCLLGFQGHSTVPSCFNLETGETLLQETFNGPLQGWEEITGNGDTPGTQGWEQFFGPGSLEGEGFMRIFGKDRDVTQCVPKSKILLSPNISIAGWENLSVTFFRSTNKLNQNLGKADSVRAIIISADESIPLQERLQQGLARSRPMVADPAKASDGWRFFGRGVTSAEIANLNGIIRLAVIYTSNPLSCEDLAVDLITLRGFQGPAPDTIITLPPNSEGTTLVNVGQVIPLRAVVADTRFNEVSFFWRIFDLSLGVEIRSFTGPAGAFVFEQPGSYLVTCSALDSDCNVDPTPDQRLIIAANSIVLDTRIVEPEGREIRIVRGKTVQFEAEGDPPSSYNYLWRVTASDVNQDTRTFEGQTVQIPFPMNGRFIVSVVAQTNDGLTDATPAHMVVQVRSTLVEIYAPTADNPRREVVVPNNLRILFRGRVEDPADTISEFFWVLNPGEEKLCQNQVDCPILFDQRGEFTVALVALAGQEVVGFDFLKILVDPQLRARIIDPKKHDEIPINTAIELRAQVSGSAASSAEVTWTVAGKIYSGQEVQVPGIDRPGRFQVRLFARDPDSDLVVQDTVDIRVFDPDNDVLPQIISPKTDLIIKPGGRVFFDSSARNARDVNRRAVWEVRKMSTQELVQASINATLGRVTFPDAGVFDVSLFLNGQDGKQFLEKRVITVKTGNPAAFNSNNKPESAAPLVSGEYYPLTLDRNHYYEIVIPEAGLTVSAKISVDGPAKLVLMNSDGVVIGTREVGAGVHALQQLNLAAGTYALIVEPLAPAPKRLVSFSLSLDVLNPALYFTDINENQNEYTIIGAVNPSGGIAEIELIAYDTQGVILGKVDTQIEGGGIKRYRVLDLFPDVAEQIAWIRVDATRQLVGFSQVSDVSNTMSYAFSAATKLSSELYAPHIAQDINTWTTRASIVNGIAEDSNSFLLSGQTPKELNNKNSFAQDDFNFLDKFGGTLPMGVEWGLFRENDGKTSLAGNEVFSKNGNDRQIVSLGLVDAPSANPNFLQQGNTFYFTHIARDVANFWTGIALVNIETVQQNAQIRGYGPGGVFVGEKSLMLQPAEKHVSLAEVFLDGIGSPENVDWVEIIADPGIVGYEIFGSWNNKQLAGLEAISERKMEICFPYVDNTGTQWHGFAVVNLSDSSTMVNFQLINDSGTVLQTVTKSLPARAKEIFVLADLFNGIPFNAGWVKATATQAIAGFELFGTDETMSGIIAQ